MKTLKKMAVSAVAALAGMMMVAPTAMANDNIRITDKVFPDTEFRTLVVNLADINPKDGFLSRNERNAVTDIDHGFGKVKNLKGVELFPNLESLDMDYNEVSQVDVRANAKLKRLLLSSNKISHIDLSKNTRLESLNLESNKLTSLDLSRNTKLTSVDISMNPLLCVSSIAASAHMGTYDKLTSTYNVAGGVLNLKQAAPMIDLKRISHIDNGRLENGLIMPIDKSRYVTYHYTFDYVHEPLEISINFTPSVWFTDVQANSTPHAVDIQWLADNKITTGWLVNGRFVFRGMDNVKRQDMAAFLRRLASRRNIANAKYYKPSAADWNMFRDVNRSTPHAEDILWLAKAGITTGWNTARGKEFRGDDTVKRQDMAAFLKRLAAKANKGQNIRGKAFADVNRSTPHWQEIQWLGGSGISTGWPSNRGPVFRGMDTVKRQDMAAFIHRLNNLLG